MMHVLRLYVATHNYDESKVVLHFKCIGKRKLLTIARCCPERVIVIVVRNPKLPEQ